MDPVKISFLNIEITKKNCIKFIKALYGHKIIRFILTGGTGLLINLLVTGILTEFVFGREHYFYGYLLGLTANMVYNFALYTVFTFKPSAKHKRRFLLYVIYYICMTLTQIGIVKMLTALVGVDWYLLVIALTIATLSVITYLTCNLFIFKKVK